MNTMYERIEDCIGDGWIAYCIMLPFHGKLSSHGRGREAISVFNGLKKVSALKWGHRGKTEIIENQGSRFGQFVHELGIGSITSRDGKFLKQLGNPDVERGKAQSVRPVCYGEGQVGFA